jgi:hypothetical protein
MNVVTPNRLPPVGDPYDTPTERIFDNGVIGGSGPKENPNDFTVYEYTVKSLIDDAQSFEESTLAPDREENLEYFYGEIPEPEGEGTSTAVSTDFRDTVMAIIPSLIRIFTSPEHVVNCHPNYMGQEEAAKQCTEYLQYMFWEDNPGFLILHDILKDALRCKIGVVKWWTDTSDEVTEQTFHNITAEQLQMLIYENDTVEAHSSVLAAPTLRTGSIAMLALMKPMFWILLTSGTVATSFVLIRMATEYQNYAKSIRSGTTTQYLRTKLSSMRILLFGALIPNLILWSGILLLSLLKTSSELRLICYAAL